MYDLPYLPYECSQLALSDLTYLLDLLSCLESLTVRTILTKRRYYERQKGIKGWLNCYSRRTVSTRIAGILNIVQVATVMGRVENGHEAVVKLLLAENGVDPDSNDIEHSRTPLSWADWARGGGEASTREGRRGPNSKDNEHGLTPLSWAAEKEHPAVVRLLVEKEFSINANGQALLETALAESYMPVVELLLEWLLELKDAGFEVADVCRCFSEGMNKSSWLAFEQPNVDMSKDKVNVHFHHLLARTTEDQLTERTIHCLIQLHSTLNEMQCKEVLLHFVGLLECFPPLRDLNEDQWCQQGGQGHFSSFALPALRN